MHGNVLPNTLPSCMQTPERRRHRFSISTLVQIQEQRHLLEQRKANGSPKHSVRSRLKIDLIAEWLLDELSCIGAELITVARSGSTYIKFSNSRVGKLRIGDHKERSRYAYRWQIRVDLEGTKVKNDKGHKQFFYGIDLLEEFVRHILNYAAKCPET